MPEEFLALWFGNHLFSGIFTVHCLQTMGPFEDLMTDRDMFAMYCMMSV
jgi:hypothetical protein